MGQENFNKLATQEDLQGVVKSHGIGQVGQIPVCDSENEVHWCDPISPVGKNKKMDQPVGVGDDNKLYTYSSIAYVDKLPFYTQAKNQLYAVHNNGKIRLFFKKYYSEGLSHQGTKITGIGNCKDTEVLIPPGIGEMPITEMDYNTFKDNQNITYVKVPDSITKIQSRAFLDMHNLKTLILPQNLKYLGEFVFHRLLTLENFCISNLKNWCELIERHSSFPRESNDTYKIYIEDRLITDTLTITKDVDYINSYALSCLPPSITTIVMEEGVKEIKKYAMTQTRLTKVVFPNSIMELEGSAFQGNYNNIIYDFTKCTNIPTFGSYVFDRNGSGFQILVPKGQKTAWSNTKNLSAYSSHIVEAQ